MRKQGRTTEAEDAIHEYARLEKSLLMRIIAGDYAPGERLPNYNQLSREFGVGQATVQKAMDRLGVDGFVRTQWRSGTYVADAPPHLAKTAIVTPFAVRDTQFYVALHEASRRIAKQGVTKFEYYHTDIAVDRRGDWERLCDDAAHHRFGAIVFTTPPYTEVGSPAITEPGIRRVMVAPESGYGMPAVGPDISSFQRRAVKYLTSRGRKRIAHLCVDVGHVSPDRVFDELASLGAELRPYWVQWASNGQLFRPAAGIARLLMELEGDKRPDALVIHDDNLIEHVIGGLLTAGVKVPEQLEIVAHTNFPNLVPSLLPIKRLGFDCEAILRKCLDVIELQKSTRSLIHVNIQAVFEEEIPGPLVNLGGRSFSPERHHASSNSGPCAWTPPPSILPCQTASHAECEAPVGSVPPQDDPAKTSLIISNKAIGKIDTRIFGQFLERPSEGETGPESLVDAKGDLPEKVLMMIKDLNPPFVRFPGGIDVDWIDWTDMIDGVPRRKGAARPITTGHGGDKVSNRFGLHEFFSLRDKVGFEVMLCVNLRDALYKERSLEDAARHAAGLLAYCNASVGQKLPSGMPDWPALRMKNGHKKPLGVRTIMVGNESYFFWPPKEKADRERIGVQDDVKAWNWFKNCILAYGKEMKAVDPSIELAMDGFHDPWNPVNAAPNAARREILKSPEIRGLYNHLCSHSYAPMGFNTCNVDGKAVDPSSLNDEQLWFGLTAAPGLIDESGQNTAFGSFYDDCVAMGYKISQTEWNWNGWDSERIINGRPFGIEVPTMLGTAGFLNGILRNSPKLSMAAQSMLLGTSWDITAIRADPEGKEDPYWLPQALPSWLYSRHCGKQLIQSELCNCPTFENPAHFAPWWPAVERLSLLDAVVTGDSDKTYIHVMNRSRSKDIPLEIWLPRLSSARVFKMFTLSPDEQSPWQKNMNPPVSDKSGQITRDLFRTVIPRHSVNVIVIQPVVA